jgi:hypothetical protein
MATFRAASLVSVTELEKLVNRLTEQSQIAESQRAQLAMRLSANNRDEETQRLLARTELGLRDVKTALRELEGEKEKLVAAREAAKQAKEADRKRRAPAPPTPAGTKLGKFVVPEWISGRAPMLLEASKDGKALQTIDLAKRDCFILGRQPELCHVTLEHASVSRQHVAILHGQPPGQAQGWFLIDLGSAHGTGASPAKGQPYARVKSDAPPFALVPGASFRIGKSSRVYTVKEDARRSRGSSSRPAPTVPERPRDDDDDSDDDDDDDMMHPDDRAAAAAPALAKRKRDEDVDAPPPPKRAAPAPPPAPEPAPPPPPPPPPAPEPEPEPAAAAPKWTTAEVNKMTVPKLKAALTELGLDTSGLKAVLKARLLEAL